MEKAGDIDCKYYLDAAYGLDGLLSREEEAELLGLIDAWKYALKTHFFCYDFAFELLVEYLNNIRSRGSVLPMYVNLKHFAAKSNYIKRIPELKRFIRHEARAARGSTERQIRVSLAKCVKRAGLQLYALDEIFSEFKRRIMPAATKRHMTLKGPPSHCRTWMLKSLDREIRRIAPGLELSQIDDFLSDIFELSKIRCKADYARDRLCSAFTPMVCRLAGIYMNKGVRYADLVNAGAYGVLRALNTFRQEKGARFSTHVKPWILKYLKRKIKDKQEWTRAKCMDSEDKLVLPDAFVAVLKEIQHAEPTSISEQGCTFTVDALATKLNLDPEALGKVIAFRDKLAHEGVKYISKSEEREQERRIARQIDKLPRERLVTTLAVLSGSECSDRFCIQKRKRRLMAKLIEKRLVRDEQLLSTVQSLVDVNWHDLSSENLQATLYLPKRKKGCRVQSPRDVLEALLSYADKNCKESITSALVQGKLEWTRGEVARMAAADVVGGIIELIAVCDLSTAWMVFSTGRNALKLLEARLDLP